MSPEEPNDNGKTRDDRLEDLFELAVEGNDDEAYGHFYESLVRLKGRYTSPTFIAKGGMKVITKVFDDKTGRYVAMAQLHAGTPKELYEPFLREAQLTALLDHPNIISIFDIGLDRRKAPFFTMELKMGKGLDELIQSLYDTSEGALSNEKINHLLEIFIKICDGMAYAHSQKVVHLDLKPENIQVGTFGEVLICDWGLGMVMGDKDLSGVELDAMLIHPDLLNHMTHFDKIKGTPGYMAPEQAMEDGEKGPFSDIYSLGALLYTILCNAAPISLAQGVEKAIDKTIRGDIVAPHKRFTSRAVAPGLASVAMKALSLEKESRYSTVEELRDDAHAYMMGYSTTAENAGFIKEFKLFYHRNRAVCNVFLFCLFIVISTTGFFIHRLNENVKVKEKALHSAEESSKQAVEEKHRAERVLELYEQEKELGETFVRENMRFLKDDVYRLTDVEFFKKPQESLEEAVRYLDKILESNPTYTWARNQRGRVNFLMQDLVNAQNDFSKDSEDTDFYRGLCIKYAAESKKGKPLPVEMLKLIITAMAKQKRLYGQIVMLMTYDAVLRKDQNDHCKVVETVLKVFNPQWIDGEFMYDLNKKHLRLRGKGLSRLITSTKDFYLLKRKGLTSIPLLGTLDITYLDVRWTEIYSFGQMAKMNMEVIDVRNTLINKSTQVRLMPSLKKVIVHKNQFRKTMLAKVEEYTEVTIK